MNEEMNNGGSVEKTPFYKKNWFVILLIIFILPSQHKQHSQNQPHKVKRSQVLTCPQP